MFIVTLSLSKCWLLRILIQTKILTLSMFRQAQHDKGFHADEVMSTRHTNQTKINTWSLFRQAQHDNGFYVRLITNVTLFLNLAISIGITGACLPRERFVQGFGVEVIPKTDHPAVVRVPRTTSFFALALSMTSSLTPQTSDFLQSKSPFFPGLHK